MLSSRSRTAHEVGSSCLSARCGPGRLIFAPVPGCGWDGTGPQRAGPSARRRHHGQQVITSALDRGACRAPSADRERLQQAARELLSSDGWARWVKTRAMFHSYSAGNCMLLARQCHERGIDPDRVAGFRTWLKLGRCVRKGETALRILAPVRSRSATSSTGEETDERRVFFKTAFVFDVSQTEPRPGRSRWRSSRRISR